MLIRFSLTVFFQYTFIEMYVILVQKFNAKRNVHLVCEHVNNHSASLVLSHPLGLPVECQFCLFYFNFPTRATFFLSLKFVELIN